MVKSKERNRLVEENLRLVHSLCRRFTDRGIEYDDLYQAGCVGLVKAADGFREDLGFAFSTYAVPVILGEIRRLFRDGGAVKVSRSVKELSLKISQLRPKLEARLGREASIGELAEELGVKSEEITEAICAGLPVSSLTVENDDGTTQLDVPVAGPEDILADRLLICSAMQNLDEDERLLIYYRYYHSLTQSKTAAMLNMTQVGVSRKEKKILEKLRCAIQKTE